MFGVLFLLFGAGVLAVANALLVTHPQFKITESIRPGNTLGSPKFPPGTSGISVRKQLEAVASQQRTVDLHYFRLFSVIALAVMVALALFLGWLAAGHVLSPVRKITMDARRITTRSLGDRIDTGGPNDEFKELADTLNDLLSRLEASFDSQRHFIANASHELRTPLSVQRAVLQVTLSDPNANLEDFKMACEEVLTFESQQDHLIDALLTLATSERGLNQRHPLDLASIAERVMETRIKDAELRGIRLNSVLAAAPTLGDPNLIERLMANLVDNALKYNLEDGMVEVQTLTRGGLSLFSVTNTGPVIPEDMIDRLFQPFERLPGQATRAVEGHGLGLSIVRAIANAHGAAIACQVRAGGGLEVEVSFSTVEE